MRVESLSVIRVHILEIDDSIAADQVDRRDREDVMLVSGRFFQIDPEAFVLLQGGFVDCESQPEGPSRFGRRIRDQPIV